MDVTVPCNSGQNALNLSEIWKRNKYSKPDIISEVKKLLKAPDADVGEICGIVFGARGGLASKSYMVLRTLGVTKRMIANWSELTVCRTLDIWNHFMRGDYWNRMTNSRIGRWARTRDQHMVPSKKPHRRPRPTDTVLNLLGGPGNLVAELDRRPQAV